MKNRRNYYRILHVQPEAPLEVIRASFRSIMSKLRAHPDLGGDHETAVLLNEAYAVLSDPERRRRYDQSLAGARTGEHKRAPGAPAVPPALPPVRSGPGQGSTETAGGVADPVRPAAAGCDQRAPLFLIGEADPMVAYVPHCAFCGLVVPRVVRRDTRCRQCQSPLALPPVAHPGLDEAMCRRMLPRVARTDAVRIHERGQPAPSNGKLRDLSLSGISVATAIAFPAGSVLRIVGPAFDVVAEVVSCRAAGGMHSVHARLLSALFPERAGTFVSMTA